MLRNTIFSRTDAVVGMSFIWHCGNVVCDWSELAAHIQCETARDQWLIFKVKYAHCEIDALSLGHLMGAAIRKTTNAIFPLSILKHKTLALKHN